MSQCSSDLPRLADFGDGRERPKYVGAQFDASDATAGNSLNIGGAFGSQFSTGDPIGNHALRYPNFLRKGVLRG